MTRIVRSNTPSLYDNPMSSSKALQNQFKNCIFDQRKIQTPDVNVSTKPNTTWAVLVGALGLAVPLALGLINKKPANTDDADTKEKAEAEAKAKAEAEAEEENKPTIIDNNIPTITVTAPAPTASVKSLNSILNSEHQNNSVTQLTADGQNKPDDEYSKTQVETTGTTQTQPETAPLGTESNPVTLGEVVIDGTAPEGLSKPALTGITITKPAVPNNNLSQLLFAPKSAPQVKNDVTQNETTTPAPAFTQTLSKEEKETRLKALEGQLTAIQKTIKSEESSNFEDTDSFNKSFTDRFKENLIKRDIENLKDIPTKEG